MKTPLFDRHIALHARMAPFAGWDMPIQYQGILPEHQATRTGCAMFDICHMGEFELEGPSAAADLERLLTCSIGTLKDGQCRYGFLLRDDGGVLDDLTCYRWTQSRYWLVVNAGTRDGDFQWIRDHISSGTALRDISDRTAKIDVQGPGSMALLTRAFGAEWPTLGYFRFTRHTADGVPMVVSRTGYTGEWGYELYFDAGRAVEVWDRLLAAGATPAGLGARDTLRLEMGYPLYGHELGVDRTPVAYARGAFIDLSKEFTGREACRKDLDSGAGRYLTGLTLEGKRAARAGDTVWVGDREVGVVTSGSLAPSIGVAVALAYVDDAFTKDGTAVEVQCRGARLAARVSPPPFYGRGTARLKAPPAM
ncbi:MAG: glycine cleavage system aminomethyltransferase GcvT [Kiritimatiellae bacterium]|nr:glycine cleavage system aminomethyltransferase GcvT [Kiritimatiellia bacterium]